MKKFTLTAAVLGLFLLGSCASSYQKIKPESLSYKSNDLDKGVTMEYKYDLLHKKYAKKEDKNDVRLVALKITNNSDQNLRFGQDFNLVYENGSGVALMETEKVFKNLKQKSAYYLFYLLLSPMQVYSTSSNSTGTTTTNSFPAGLIVGPGLTAGNMIGASAANKNFKEELMQHDIAGRNIKPGETVYGLIGIRADNYDALKLQFSNVKTEDGKKPIALN